MRSKALLAILCALAFVTGCSGPSGLLGTERHPDGDIVVESYPGNAVLTTSTSAPYSVSGAFSISISENAFSGPYDVTMYSWHNNFNVPCFEPIAKSATIFEFEPVHENAPGSTAENPCETGDVETALINDGKGHDLYFSFETSVALTGVAPTPAPSATGVACSQGDPLEGGVTLTGATQIIPFPTCNAYTISGTMPPNGGDGDGFSIGVSGDSQFGDSTTSADGTPVLALAMQPSPNAFTFTDTTQSFAISVSNPNLSGTYTMELRENNTVIQTIPQIQPSNGEIFFNVHPLNGEFALSEYVAILYRN